MRVRPPVQHLLKVDGVHGAGVGDFAKEFAKNGNAQILVADAPIEARAGARLGCAMPEHPGGKHAVKERLDEGGAKEVVAFVAFEFMPSASSRAFLTASKLARGWSSARARASRA